VAAPFPQAARLESPRLHVFAMGILKLRSLLRGDLVTKRQIDWHATWEPESHFALGTPGNCFAPGNDWSLPILRDPAIAGPSDCGAQRLRGSALSGPALSGPALSGPAVSGQDDEPPSTT
jgi:hypothetical protein